MKGKQRKSSANLKWRESSNAGINDNEARSLLRRSLFISSTVATDDDWAVLAGRNLDLGALRIEGGVWFKVASDWTTILIPQLQCYKLIGIGECQWHQPIIRGITCRYFVRGQYWQQSMGSTNATYFSGDGTIDEGIYEPSIQRIWHSTTQWLWIQTIQAAKITGWLRRSRDLLNRMRTPTSNQPDKDELHEIPIPTRQIKNFARTEAS